MEKIKTETLLDNRQLREQLKDRVEVLDKVKAVLLIPQMEYMTIRQVADYYEVDIDTVQKICIRNKPEFISDGMSIKTPLDFKFLKGTTCPFKNLQQVNGKLVVQVDDNVTLEIPNRGIKCFPKRAILRMGMLLRDSRIAQEVRTQLLNIVENVEETNPIVLTESINEEEKLIFELGKAMAVGTKDELMWSAKNYIDFTKRHINELEKDKEHLESANKILINDNKLLSGEALEWSNRSMAVAVMRKLSYALHQKYDETYEMLYKHLKYKYGMDIKARNNGKKPYIANIKDNEWKNVHQSISALLLDKGFNPTKFYEEIKKGITVHR